MLHGVSLNVKCFVLKWAITYGVYCSLFGETYAYLNFI
jgi:hypothetical protein